MTAKATLSNGQPKLDHVVCTSTPFGKGDIIVAKTCIKNPSRMPARPKYYSKSYHRRGYEAVDGKGVKV